MKKKRWFFYVAIFVFLISLSLGTHSKTAEAATVKNVMQSKKANSGRWVASKKGYRYKYTKSGTYANNAWLNIGGSIYYFKSDGYLQVGWKTYQGYKYYFDNQGKIVTGWRKINNSYYYLNPQNGRLAVNTVVNGYKVDKNGKRESKVSKRNVDIFVGDSRTVGMGCAVGIKNKCIAKVGQGYNWFINTAQTELKNRLKSNPTATVVFALGVNDVDNVSKYIAKYQSLEKQYPKAKFFYLAVNPVNSNYKKHATLTPKIISFNQKLKKAFPNQYIDTYNYLTKEKFQSSDGLHYSNSVYKKLYEFILDEVAKKL